MKKANRTDQKIFDYFKLEKTGLDTVALGDFANKDFSDWLRMIHDLIQDAMRTKLFDGQKIENYLNLTFYFGGQRVDVAIVKDGRKGPEELYKALLKEAGKWI
jgi:hypothetical protein